MAVRKISESGLFSAEFTLVTEGKVGFRNGKKLREKMAIENEKSWTMKFIKLKIKKAHKPQPEFGTYI